jgi:hypothetical protein
LQDFFVLDFRLKKPFSILPAMQVTGKRDPRFRDGDDQGAGAGCEVLAFFSSRRSFFTSSQQLGLLGPLFTIFFCGGGGGGGGSATAGSVRMTISGHDPALIETPPQHSAGGT